MPGSTALLASVLVACSGRDDTVDTAVSFRQGVVVPHRTADGGLLIDGRTYLGGAGSAESDAGGFVYYVDLPPGRMPISFELDGHAMTYAAPEVRVDAMSIASLVPHPLDALEVTDPQGAVDLAGDGFVLQIPAGVMEHDELPVSEPWTLGHDRIRAADRVGIPGDLLALRNDVDLSRFVVDELIVLRATVGEDDLRLADDARMSLVVELAADSPLLEPDADVFLYQYSHSATYWSFAGRPVIDAAARTATLEPGSLGWWALGREPADRSCVRGVVVDHRGDPLDGAEVTLVQEAGTLGIDRVSTEGGLFCLPVDVGAAAQLRVVGVAPDLSRLYRWAGSATGGAAATCGSPECVDLGEIAPEGWEDEDEDSAWGGPGGDCDDRDPAVNPSVGFGDGSYCGSAL